MMTSARPCRAYRRGTRDPEALGLDTKGRRRNLRPARPALTRTLGVAVGDCEHLGEPRQPQLAQIPRSRHREYAPPAAANAPGPAVAAKKGGPEAALLVRSVADDHARERPDIGL